MICDIHRRMELHNVMLIIVDSIAFIGALLSLVFIFRIWNKTRSNGIKIMFVSLLWLTIIRLLILINLFTESDCIETEVLAGMASVSLLLLAYAFYVFNRDTNKIL